MAFEYGMFTLGLKDYYMNGSVREIFASKVNEWSFALSLYKGKVHYHLCSCQLAFNKLF